MKKIASIISALVFIIAGTLRAEVLLQQGQTSHPLEFVLISSSDHIAGLTGATPTVTISKNGGTFASPSGTVSEVGNGLYKIAGNATDENTLGPIVINATASGADPCTDVRHLVVGFDPYDSQRIGLASLPSSGTLAVKPAVTLAASDVTGNVAADIQTIKTQTVTAAGGVTFPSSIGTSTLTGAQAATAVWQDSTAGDFTVASSIGKTLYINNKAPGSLGGLPLSVDASGSVNMYTWQGTVFGTNEITGLQNLATEYFNFSSVTASVDNSAIASAVWKDAVAGDFTTLNSIGKSLYTTAAPGASGGHFIAGSNAATTVASFTSTGNFTINGVSNVAQTGDSFARIGANGAGLTVVGDARLANLDATMSSRLAASAYTAAPTTSQVAAAILRTPANLLTTDSNGFVTFNNTTIANLTNLPGITAGWLTATGIASGALNGKGDWATAANVTTAQNNIITHGDANWTGGGGGGGSGPVGPDAVSISTLVTTNPLGTVAVYLSQGGTNYNFGTNAGGTSSGGLTSGSYTIVAAKDGYQLASVTVGGAATWNGSTVTITGACTINITMSPVTYPAPTDPTMCVVQFKVVSQKTLQPLPNATVFAYLKANQPGNGSAYLSDGPMPLTSDGSGVVTVQLPRSSVWSISASSSQPAPSSVLNVPNTANFISPNMRF